MKLLMRKLHVLAVIGSVFAAAGCDPVSTTSQSLQIRVTRQQTKEAVEGATIHLKRPYSQAIVSLRGTSDEEWIDRPPTFVGITKADGIADIEVTATAIDHWQLKPEDRVTGKSYVFAVATGKSRGVFRMKARSGESTVQENFIVSVLSVGEPRYVETP